MAVSQVPPLQTNVPIVYPAGHPLEGCPTPFFQAMVQQWLVEKAVTDGQAQGAAVAGDAASSGLTASSHTVLGNKEAAAGAIEELTASQVLDLIGSTRGQILFRGATGWSVLAPGTSGNFLKTNGAGADPAWAAATGGSGKVSFVASAAVSGAAATSLALSSLDLNTDQRWFIRGSVKNATASTSNLSLYFNADTAATNYNRQIIQAINTTVNGSRANDAIVTGMDGNTAGTGAGDTEFYGWIFVTQSGFVMADIHSMRTGNTTIELQRLVTQWRASGTNVTGVTISASVASSLAIGSKIEMWKLST